MISNRKTRLSAHTSKRFRAVSMKLLQLISLLLMTSPLAAQLRVGDETADLPLRVEIPARSAGETYRIIPCGPESMVLFYRSVEMSGESNVRWYFSLYDTVLQQLWVKSIPLNADLECRSETFSNDTLSLLFVHMGKTKGRPRSFAILQLVTNEGLFLMNSGTIREQEEITFFSLKKGRAWLGINAKGQPGTIRTIRLSDGRTTSFPLGQGNAIALKWMDADTSSNQINAIVSRTISKKVVEYYLVRYDTAGSIKRELMMGTQQGDRQLTHVRVFSGAGGDDLILGTYGQAASNQRNNEIVEDASAGFFSCAFSGGTLKSFNFLNFLELRHSNSFLGETQASDIKKKANKKNKSISEYTLEYSVLLHEIEEWNGEYLMLAEVFSPQYRTETFTDFDYYGRPYTNTYSVFEGYRFYNAILASFNKDGKLLWDNTIEIRNLVTADLNQKICMIRDGEELILCYESDGKIGSRIIKRGEVTEKLDFANLDLMHPTDNLLSEARGRIVPWYRNYFLTYGYQEIKNIELDQNNRRLVFYFTKVRFDR